MQGISDSDSHAPGARLVAGQIQKSRNRMRLAEGLFLEAIRLDPKLARARRELILIYAMQARRLDLNAQFAALSALEPLNYDDVLLWTASLEDIWFNDSIRSDLERYIEADPEDRSSRLALATVLLRSGEMEKAEALLQFLPEDDSECRVFRARIELRRSNLDKFKALLAEGPAEDVGLALLRGQLAASSNDPTAGAQQFRIALRLDPTNREATQGLFLSLRRLGKQAEADAYREKGDRWRALTGLLENARGTQHRRNKPMLEQLATTCESLGRYHEAEAWYRLLLDIDPTDSTVQQALHRLSDGPLKSSSQGQTN
jgi:tetratricopeptide (TPR) repeat protein